MRIAGRKVSNRLTNASIPASSFVKRLRIPGEQCSKGYNDSQAESHLIAGYIVALPKLLWGGTETFVTELIGSLSEAFREA